MIAAMGAITTLGFIVWAHHIYDMGLADHTRDSLNYLRLMSSLIFTGKCKVRGATQTITREVNVQFLV